MKKSIGILYICTGDYYLFWKDFYSSFNEKFLPDTLKRYYVFTDRPEKIQQNDFVKVYYIDPLSWPLITLLRFHYFVRFQKEFSCNDYLMFANSNLICREIIHEDEFLPAPDQELSCVLHPGLYRKKARYIAYERDRKSTAYVPYNCSGCGYVMGGLICGHKDKFMRMSEILSGRINQDFSNRKIAIWHDESQYNKYIIEHSNNRVLSPAYGYPEGWNLPFDKKIEILQKSKHFDVDSFKEVAKPEKINFFSRKMFGFIRNFKQFARCNLCYLRDLLLFRHI